MVAVCAPGPVRTPQRSPPFFLSADFAEEFGDHDDGFWNFSRVHNYGFRHAPPLLLLLLLLLLPPPLPLLRAASQCPVHQPLPSLHVLGAGKPSRMSSTECTSAECCGCACCQLPRCALLSSHHPDGCSAVLPGAARVSCHAAR